MTNNSDLAKVLQGSARAHLCRGLFRPREVRGGQERARAGDPEPRDERGPHPRVLEQDGHADRRVFCEGGERPGAAVAVAGVQCAEHKAYCGHHRGGRDGGNTVAC